MEAVFYNQMSVKGLVTYIRNLPDPGDLAIAAANKLEVLDQALGKSTVELELALEKIRRLEVMARELKHYAELVEGQSAKLRIVDEE
jgi:hypothetical protein